MFRMIIVMVLIVVVVGASEVSGRIYTGPGGSYTPQAGEVVKELPNAKLEVTRADKSTFVVDLSEQKPTWVEEVVVQKQPAIYVSPAPVYYQPVGQSFVYKNGQRVGSGSTVYIDSRDQVTLRQQDLREQEARHEMSMDWARQNQEYQRDQADRARQQQYVEQRARQDQIRQQENLRRDAIRVGQQFGRQAQSVRRDVGNRLERYLRSQN